MHEKYHLGTTKKKAPLEVREFKEVLQGVSEENKDLQPYIGRAQEMLNPLVVLKLFKRIPDEVDKMCASVHNSTCYIALHSFIISITYNQGCIFV